MSTFWGTDHWLGMRDSNPRISVPETDALPLGQSPTIKKSVFTLGIVANLFNCSSGLFVLLVFEDEEIFDFCVESFGYFVR